MSILSSVVDFNEKVVGDLQKLAAAQTTLQADLSAMVEAANAVAGTLGQNGIVIPLLVQSKISAIQKLIAALPQFQALTGDLGNELSAFVAQWDKTLTDVDHIFNPPAPAA